MAQTIAQTIGASARGARQRLGLTQEDAAERIGISSAFYARIERGTTLPSVPTFARIVEVLGASADELLGRKARPGLGVAEPAAVYRPTPKAAPSLGAHDVDGFVANRSPDQARALRRLMRRLRLGSPSAIRAMSLLARELVAVKRPRPSLRKKR